MTTGRHQAAGPASGGDVPALTAASRREAPAATPNSGWVPDGVDITVAAPARVYNCALGGMHHFEVDRQLWARIEHSYPPAPWAARANRAFLARATRWLAGLGVRQFLDIGAGIPTLEATHETARETNPTARVVYVDIDPVAVEQAESMLAGDPNARAIRGDLRDPEQILTDPVVTAFGYGREQQTRLVASSNTAKSVAHIADGREVRHQRTPWRRLGAAQRRTRSWCRVSRPRASDAGRVRSMVTTTWCRR
jgi:hypothetical protein